MVSVRNAILVCIITRLVWDAALFVAYEYTHEEAEELENALKEGLPGMSMTKKLWLHFHLLEPEKQLDRATVLCVLLGLNREWFQNLFHVGLIIMSLLYDPVVAVCVYGYVVLTPDQDEHVE